MSESYEEKVKAVILGKEDAETVSKFMAAFGEELGKFSKIMGEAYDEWKSLDSSVSTPEQSMICELILSTLSSQVISMKLFMQGLMVPAGNMQRQAIEGLCIALLCSSQKLTVAKQFIDGKYSSKNSVKHLRQKHAVVGVSIDAVKNLEFHVEHYSSFSHAGLMPMGAGLNHLNLEETFIGGHFDEGKVDLYRIEVGWRVSLAEDFPPAIQLIGQNLVRV